ncbi:hypothetical protein [Wielerella bovis]|uniref:hypothetical protein n=1 Tax=Wielerella bovis TaxID=2917790 RepID=UPI00201A17E2|nr:hypothetical protein [Wielerella bovis]ULJ60301.1 hypothetical protein MIS44_11810 [Wielerella bovis]
MNDWKILYFLPFIFIACVNLRILLAQLRENKNSSFAPVLGLMCFFLGTLGLDKDYNPWIWLLVLLDIGTLVLIWSLPFLLKEWFINSRFCRYRVYRNNTQILTLYQFKQHRTFNWQYIGKIKPENVPVLVGFGGEWTIIDDKLHLNIVGGRNIAVADMENDELVFAEIDHEHYARLCHQRLKQK